MPNIIYPSSVRKPTVFLTGASSGIGRAMALRLVAEGYEVWGTSRTLARLTAASSFHPVALDFSIHETIQLAWIRALEESGGIDIVIQNAGSGIFGSIEEISLEQARQQWVTLVEGPLVLWKLAAEHLRTKRAGWLIGVSSLAAEMPMPFFGHYSAGKAALSSLLANLGMELEPFGIHVVDFRPGDFKTTFNNSVFKVTKADSPYSDWSQRMWKKSCQLLNSAPEPERAADDLIKLLNQKQPPAVWRSGSFFQRVIGALGVRALSRRALLKSIRSYYALCSVDRKKVQK